MDDCPMDHLHSGAVFVATQVKRDYCAGHWEIDGVTVSTTHVQRKCPGCDLYKIWVPKPTVCPSCKSRRCLGASDHSAVCAHRNDFADELEGN